MDYCDHIRLMTLECHTFYCRNLPRTKLLSDREIYLDNVSKTLQDLYEKLESIGWRFFSLDPCISNEQWVHEFYANISEVSFSDTLNVAVKILGKSVKVGDKQINHIYGLKKEDIGEF